MVVYEGRNGENNGEKLSVKQRAQLETLYCFLHTHARPLITSIS